MVACVLAEGFFAGSEIAIVSVNRVHLRHLVEKGSARARALHQMLEHPEWFLGATLVGTNLSIVTLNAVATYFVIKTWGPKFELLTILFTWPFMLVFGEMLPKAICQAHADRWARYLVFPLRIVSIVLAPAVVLVARLSRLFLRMGQVKSRKITPLLTREELELMFRASKRGEGIQAIERSMIDRIFAFSDKQVRDVMIPLTEMIAVREDSSVAEAAEIMRKYGFSRLPVYSWRVYKVIGWVNHYDLLLAKDRQRRVSEIVRPLRYIPPSVKLDRLLASMQKRSDSLAVVVDEYGGAQGLVTLEDVMEEIVGDIEDEYDTVSPMLTRLNPKTILVSARMPVGQLSEALHITIPPGDYETLGGFLTSQMQRIPKVGEEFIWRKVTFHIRQASERSIEEVEVRQGKGIE